MGGWGFVASAKRENVGVWGRSPQGKGAGPVCCLLVVGCAACMAYAAVDCGNNCKLMPWACMLVHCVMCRAVELGSPGYLVRLIPRKRAVFE